MASALSTALSEDDPGNLDDLLKLHVREAVRSRSHAGSSNARSLPYSSLVNQIRTVKEQALRDGNEDHVEQLISILDALTACVSSLHERNHETLIHELLTIPIWKTCQGVRTALLQLLIHMVVANSALVPLCLRVLVLAMQPPSVPSKKDEEAALALAAWQPAAGIVVIQSEVVAALEKILRLVPTVPSRMVATVAAGIPYKLRDRDAQCTYLHGALQLAEQPAAVPVREGILAAAVNHLLGLDVEIRWQDIATAEAEAEEEEEGESEKEEEDIFALEGETEHLNISTPGQPQEQPNQERIQGRGGWEGAARGADAAEASTSGRPASTETAEKLDALMDLVFKHLERRCEQGQLAGAWATLLHTFEQSILDTHRSKFTQYLLWYMCRQGPQQCSASFLQLLLQRLTNPNVAPITRSAAAAYLASFLARASFIPEPLLLQTLQSLAGWCLSYCRDQDSKDMALASVISTAHTSTRLDLDTGPAKGIQHQVFYAACQALLYILCYRLDHLMAASQPAHGLESTSPTGVLDGAAVHAQLRQLFADTMPQVLNHRLAPLSVCLPTVVAEFSRLVARLGLMDCAQLLPQRSQAMRAQRPLEMFFPFDPYLLRRSAQHLDLGKTYVHWKQGHPQAAAQETHDDASDVSSEEGVNAASDSDDVEKEAGSDEEDSDSGLESSDGTASDEEDARMNMAPRRTAQRQRHKTWPPPPLGGIGRPVSAQPSSRKRAASGTPGSDQGFLPGASFDTNSFSGASLHGTSPGVSPPGMPVPMSWSQPASQAAALRMQRALEQPIDAQ